MDATFLLGIAVEHAAAAVRALAGAQEVRWQGFAGEAYRAALARSRLAAAAALARLEEERAEAVAWEVVP